MLHFLIPLPSYLSNNNCLFRRTQWGIFHLFQSQPKSILCFLFFQSFRKSKQTLLPQTSLNLVLGLVTSCCDRQTACWRPAYCWQVSCRHSQKSFATFGLGSTSWILVTNWKKYPCQFHWQRGFLALAMVVRLGWVW